MWIRIVLFFLIFGLAEYYSFIVVRSALRTAPSALRIGVLVLYFILTAMSWLSIVLFRQLNWANMPHMARNIFVAFNLGFILGKVLILLVMLTDEIRRLFVWVVSMFMTSGAPETAKSDGISRSIFLQRLALILGGTMLGGFLYGITNRYAYKVRRVKIAFDNLPAAFKGLKIVQISDIHSGSFDSHHAVERGAELVMQENADLVFFTGDLVNNHAFEIEPYIDIFSKIKAPLGVYSTLGNHDYGDYVPWPSKAEKIKNLETLKQHHATIGWKLMMNEHVVLERGGDKIAVLGIENWGAKAGFPKYGNMAQAYAGLPEKNVPFKILLSHDPSHWDAQVRPEYPEIDLTLSGHTHGMQLGVEIPGLKWSPVQYIYRNWAGLYKEGKQHLYVNPGFGFLGYPGRLGILPEITVIELV